MMEKKKDGTVSFAARRHFIGCVKSSLCGYGAREHSLFVCDILRSFFGTFLKEYGLLLGSPRGGGWHESCLTST